VGNGDRGDQRKGKGTSASPTIITKGSKREKERETVVDPTTTDRLKRAKLPLTDCRGGKKATRKEKGTVNLLKKNVRKKKPTLHINL